jgi:hypothetical protein
MRIHAIETGRVRIKQAQISGRGHGLWRQLQPILSLEWADWSPVYAWVIEHREGAIVVDTGSNVGLKSLPRWHLIFSSASVSAECVLNASGRPYRCRHRLIPRAMCRSWCAMENTKSYSPAMRHILNRQCRAARSAA